jgi:hypothetical protein
MTRLLGHLVSLEIASPDVEASATFYERKFGSASWFVSVTRCTCGAGAITTATASSSHRAPTPGWRT